MQACRPPFRALERAGVARAWSLPPLRIIQRSHRDPEAVKVGGTGDDHHQQQWRQMEAGITTLILPGLGNSGPDHWQSRWERADPRCIRVLQEEWNSPHVGAWSGRLGYVVDSHDAPLVLVAHSSACAMVAHWARQASPDALKKIRGALLVAPSDPDSPNYPVGPVGFGPVPHETLPFRSIVVASDSDRYLSVDRASAYAAAWGSRLVVLSQAGHINAASGLGDWPQGWSLLQELRHPEAI